MKKIDFTANNVLVKVKVNSSFLLVAKNPDPKQQEQKHDLKDLKIEEIEVIGMGDQIGVRNIDEPATVLSRLKVGDKVIVDPNILNRLNCCNEFIGAKENPNDDVGG